MLHTSDPGNNSSGRAPPRRIHLPGSEEMRTDNEGVTELWGILQSTLQPS